MGDSWDLIEATVKRYDAVKGFGVVALKDGIALLRAAVLEKAGIKDVTVGMVLWVELEQSIGGMIVAVAQLPWESDEWEVLDRGEVKPAGTKYKYPAWRREELKARGIFEPWMDEFIEDENGG